LWWGDRREEEAIAKKPKKRINGEGSIYQRKSDGRWVGQFKDDAASGSGIRYVYAKTQQEALKKLKEEMARAEAGLIGEAGRTTLAEYLDWWMENVVRDEVAHRTYHNYLSQVRNHIVPRLGKKKLKALKLEDAEGLYRSMAASGLSPATIRYVHAVLRRALNRAFVRGLVPRNVADGASLPRADQKETEAFTPEEVRRFLQAAKHDRLEALYVLAITCGLRQGELLGLRWDDVDLEAGRLTVRRQVQRSRDGSGMISGPTKNKKSRTIRLGRVAVEALKAHRDAQAEDVASAKGLWGDPNLVFASTIGTPLDPSNLVGRSFKPLLGRAGLPSIRFHDLRHACATLLFFEGVPVKVVQEVLGHSSVSVTMDVYSHILPDMQERAAAAMDELLSERP
jgi:integrase